MQTESPDRQRRRMRFELTNVIFEYLDIFYSRPRRHSVLGVLS